MRLPPQSVRFTSLPWTAKLIMHYSDFDSVDQLLSQEDQSIEELVSLMEHTERAGEDDYQRHARTDYGSDEDEYDLLFREVLSKNETVDGCPRNTHTYTVEVTADRNQDHEMDFSVG